MTTLLRTRRFPPLNALRAFEAAARHLNFRLAADELGVTQGAVAQQVRHLEDVVAVQLFRRLPRGLALTREGLEYFSSVQRALQIISDATDALGERPTVLAVSTTPSFASKWLIPRLADFGRLHPDIEVRVIADERLASFRADGVDIAIRLSKPPFPAGLAAELLAPLDIFAVASPKLLDSGPPIRTPADLSTHALLHDAHDLWPEFIEKLGGKGRADPTKGPRFSQSLLAIDAAVAGQGIALTSEPLVERDIAEGRLRRVFDFSFPMSLGFYVVFPQANAHSEALQAMRRWLFAQYGKA
ncbi:bacterial regulatory helix-turn-helix, lysR family protein [Burkholderia ambifaria AMMD]|uniref:Transcriptional regulator, LysR family n=1 Tax=Burkholderia ambifaria (strain ATCC BAA-244 / DSM 16087 / CCUG 44356 / LMG 19182 / AMMD) TaxID=339670 RepID=Q0B825_BURCM|nr:transcriptional regulator GcvA [Burkholderia ambifaria]ABI89698.1 transcriptional regulator, LysR family [Burkholderia ambifaria AMMD]AJY25843.1 bacterial regulatory helix-turn-helix, lysR family protein [Burkholderia ambifaria AMMD]MBR7930239.1 transcriptional regulator GcvA [Burkholderia ambifaria]PEH67813.1 transcriptional regulator GcvA [Burkholderia ambifaria]QQC07646.1 transcriptional regulator GcvA [Burkholderia ambifaria]